MKKTHYLKVWGDYACFTRPEIKFEKMTYDVPTPSAVRGILETILWKPQIQWQINQIHILKPIQYFSITRNELELKMGLGRKACYIEDSHQQSSSTILKDVAYIIEAQINVVDPSESQIKYDEMFSRRASKGQCVRQPYLGCREFSCYFEYLSAEDLELPENQPLSELNQDFSIMFFDMLSKKIKKSYEFTPQFFRASAEQGIIKVPAPNSQEIHK